MADERRIYQAIEAISTDGAEAAIHRDDPAELLLVAISVGLYSDDLPWAEQFSLRLAAHPHFNVRGNAVLAFGHLARRFRMLQQSASVDVVRRGLADPDRFVRRQAEAAADDIEWFAKIPVRPEGDAK
jgi:hypothetical protein